MAGSRPINFLHSTAEVMNSGRPRTNLVRSRAKGLNLGPSGYQSSTLTTQPRWLHLPSQPSPYDQKWPVLTIHKTNQYLEETVSCLPKVMVVYWVWVLHSLFLENITKQFKEQFTSRYVVSFSKKCLILSQPEIIAF